MTQTLQAVEVAGPHRWRWVLSAGSGRVLADHEVDLDVGTGEYEAFCDLVGHLDRHRPPHHPIGSRTRAVDRVSAWISERVFGEELLSCLSGSVRVLVPRGAEFLLSRPLELARVDGIPLARKQISLVYEPSCADVPHVKDDVAGSLRMLAVFSAPAGSSRHAARRERHELARTIRTVAATSGKAIDLRVLDRGVTRERLAEAVEEHPGWDVVHVSGHGAVGALVLERADGGPDVVPTDDLVALLGPTRDRLKLAVLSVCRSGAVEAATALEVLGLHTPGLHTLGLDDLTEPVGPDDGSAGQVGLACALVRELGVTALAMRYPVADGFAAALAGELYRALFGAGLPVDRAAALAVHGAAGERPAATVSAGSPVLIGAGTVGLRVAPPPGNAVLDPHAERVTWLPPEPERFVGRARALEEAGTALAPESGRAGVLFVGVAGVGKSACALELAHRHRDRFGTLTWWQAPDRPDEFGQALVDLATALEARLDLPVPDAVGGEAELRRFLPRLTEVLRDEAVLLVLDGVDSLLADDGTWRDPLWGPLVDALLHHGGRSRVVFTSRDVPGDLDRDLVAVLPLPALSIAESVLLARELPHLGPLLLDRPTADRIPDRSADGLPSVRRVLNAAQGHPELLELADVAAASPHGLADVVAAAEAAGRGAPVAAFSTTGISALDGDQFTRLLSAWTGAALALLPPPARTLLELLAHVEDGERRSWLVHAVWRQVCEALPGGRHASALESALAPLVAALVVEVDGDDPARHVYRLRPGVAEAVRAGTDPAFGALVDDRTIECLAPRHEPAHAEQAQEQDRSDAVIAPTGPAAAPYLLRTGRRAQAVDVLEAVTGHDAAPGANRRAMGYLRHMLERDGYSVERPDVTARYAELLSGSDPQAAAELLLDLVRTGAGSGRFDIVSRAASACARIFVDLGDLGSALELVRLLPRFTDLAGYGPWTRAADTCLELTVLTRTGRHHEAASRATALVDVVDGLADEDGGAPERVTPVSTRGSVLGTALEAVTRIADWHVALRLCERIDALHLRWGATDHERARARLDTASVLLRLDRVTEADDVLRHGRAVFEDAGDTVLLGAVFRLRAEVSDALGRPEDALTMAQAALRCAYGGPDPAELADGHDGVASRLAATGKHPRVCAAHRTAATVLRAAASDTARGTTFVQLSDLLRYGPDLFPGTLAELVETVEQLPGVRLGRVLAGLVPDDQERTDLFDQVVSVPREDLRIGPGAARDRRERRDVLAAASQRAGDGEPDPSPSEEPDESTLVVLAAFRALRRRRTERRRRAEPPAGEPRLFGAQVVPAMGDHLGAVHFTGFARLDGRPVAVTADEEAVRTWDLRTHRRLGEPIGRSGVRLSAAALATVGDRPVAVLGLGPELDLWDLATREHLGGVAAPHRWRGGTAISTVACTVWNGRSLAVTGSHDAAVRLWDLDRREQIGAPLTGHESVVRATAFGTVDGRLVVVSGSEDATVRVWDVAGHRQVCVLHGHEDYVEAVAVGEVDGTPVAISGSRDETVQVWDLRAREELGDYFPDHEDPVEAVAFGVLRGAPVAITGGEDEAVRLWDLRTHEQIGPALTEGRVAMGITAVALGELDGRPVLLAGDHDGVLRVWDLDAHREIGPDVPARFAAELPARWTDRRTGATYDLAEPIIDDEGSQWVQVDFDGFEPILAEPGNFRVRLNLRDVDDRYGLDRIVTPPRPPLGPS